MPLRRNPARIFLLVIFDAPEEISKVMGDTRFPAVMANGGEFLQGFTRRKGLIAQKESGQPPLRRDV